MYGFMIDYGGNLGGYEIVDWTKQRILPTVLN